MKTLRFKVGDLARIVCDRDRVIPGVVGEVVEIVSIGCHGRYNGQPWTSDYGIKIAGDPRYGAEDFELAPLPPDFHFAPATLALFTRTQRNPDDVPERVKA